jgi:hypothetical protein
MINDRVFSNGCQHSCGLLSKFKNEGYYMVGKGVDLPLLQTEIKEGKKNTIKVKPKDLTDSKWIIAYNHTTRWFYLIQTCKIKPFTTKCRLKSVSFHYIEKNALLITTDLHQILTTIEDRRSKTDF